ncbi:tetratricopeptide repeat-containing sensor histidine kinase [Algoriphagus formosus]|uniref:tetratricopeptide repeat-containing sensor histidine kinase n=1 Tax=Algoriphagus formosus TaxID=2007308 RepID=UPI0012FDDA08|nr:tetratricopeptide repeat protein [Algoriphagus formosus]
MSYKLYKKLLSLCFLVFASIPLGLAQQVNVDSLRNLLPSLNSESRVDVLNQLGTELRERSQQEAMDYSFEADSIAKEIQYLSGEARAKENIGWINYRRGKWQTAFEYSETAFGLATQINDSLQIARILNNIGALYFEQQNFKMALLQFQNAYDAVEGKDDLYTQIRSLNNLAYIYSQLGNYDSALFFAKKAININEASGSPYLTSFSNRVIGDVYLSQGYLDSASIIFENSLDMARRQGLSTTLASVMHRLGDTYLRKGELDKAEAILLEGVEVSKANNFRDELAKSHKYLAELYEQKGNLRMSLQHLNSYVSINDSLTNKMNQDRISLMQGMFQDNLEKSEVELLKAQNQNQADRLAFINRIVWIMSIAAIIVLVLGFWVVKFNLDIRKINADLVAQQQKIASQNADLERKSEQLQTINETKNKLFSILSHDLKGPIASVKGLIDMTVGGDISQEEFFEILNTLKKDVDSVHFTLSNTLNWSLSQMEGFKLNPVKVNLNSLFKNTEHLLSRQIQSKSLHIKNELPEDLDLMIDQDLIEVVMRNILSNAIKYSPENGVIRSFIKENQSSLIWCVEDEGKGVNPEQISQILREDYSITQSKPGTQKEKGSGLGLQVCKEFVRMVDGNLSIENISGKGARVCVHFPASLLISETNSVFS